MAGDIPPSRRFVAGATCPQCKALDRIVVFTEGEDKVQACIACGFREVMAFGKVIRELETRVNRSSAEREAEVKPLRFIDPPPGSGNGGR